MAFQWRWCHARPSHEALWSSNSLLSKMAIDFVELPCFYLLKMLVFQFAMSTLTGGYSDQHQWRRGSTSLQPLWAQPGKELQRCAAFTTSHVSPKLATIPGWWYTYPSEKHESQLGWWHSIYIYIYIYILWKNKKCSKPPTRFTCPKFQRRLWMHKLYYTTGPQILMVDFLLFLVKIAISEVYPAMHPILQYIPLLESAPRTSTLC